MTGLATGTIICRSPSLRPHETPLYNLIGSDVVVQASTFFSELHALTSRASQNPRPRNRASRPLHRYHEAWCRPSLQPPRFEQDHHHFARFSTRSSLSASWEPWRRQHRKEVDGNFNSSRSQGLLRPARERPSRTGLDQ
ncbi:hypothetical protein HYQ46_011123 [Verticillium longisporum]|nr:hypothetical protein HYQ46_011123 [Verticillium longisporum]